MKISTLLITGILARCYLSGVMPSGALGVQSDQSLGFTNEA